MPDPQTPNLGLYIPLNGADVGTWDVPMNANFSALDNALGAVTNVGLTNVNVGLSPSQYACLYINFTGTLTGNVSVQFPTFQRIWIVRNGCTNNTTFYVGCTANVASRQPCLPPNETVMLACDGLNMDILGLDRVGTYRDFGTTAVPVWISNSIPAPYLNCDGTTFSSATYPALRDYLGTATLPDSRGRTRFNLNQGTGRLTGVAAANGLYGESSGFLQGGGNQLIPQVAIPNYNLTVTDPGHTHGISGAGLVLGGPANVGGADFGIASNLTISSAFTGITVNSGGSGAGFAPPGYIGGITLIRAA